MNFQDILNVGNIGIGNIVASNITVSNINGSAYPPIVPADSLSNVLNAGNSAGTFDINMNFQDILNVGNIDVGNIVASNITVSNINGSAYPPIVPADTLSDVLTAGNSAGNIDINMNFQDILNVGNIDASNILVDDGSGASTKIEPAFVCIEQGPDRGGMKLTPATDFCFGTFNNLDMHFKTNNITRSTIDGLTGDMEMFGNLLVSNITVSNINGSAYPPIVPADTLSDVLTAGNSAGNIDIDMNFQDILNVGNIGIGNIVASNITVSNINVDNISVSNIIVDTILAPTNDYKIDTRNRIYQELNEGNTWGAVNGYYGLSKDAYPLPDPTSAGVKAVQTWNASSSIGTTNQWRGVCWSPQLRIFVAVASTGSLNRAATSPDGITWTLRTTNDNEWQKVCWSPELGLFAAVSSSGSLDRVMTSPDGITWTTQTTPNDNTFSDICWSPELGLFAAVSNGGVTNRVITSPDGITWSERATAAYNLFAICWAPELSLFVGIGAFQHMVHSTDGITWISFLSGIPNDIRGITWSPELGIFVAIGRTNPDRARTSPDGITWTARTIVDRDYQKVRWSPELGVFVAICNCNSTQSVTYSPDGITWTSTVTTGPNFQVLRDVAWAPELGLFAAVASGGTARAWFSSHTGRPPTSYNVFDSDSNRINNNTRDWTLQVSNLTSSRTQIDSGARLNQLLETGNSWSAINGYYGLAKDAYPTLNPYSSGNLAVSTWTTRTSAADLTWGYITWSPELRLFCAVALSGSGNRVQTSPDGINWTSRTTPVDNNWRSVCWSRERGIFVAVSITGNLDRVMTSPDGITWTTQTTNNNEWRYVIWCKELEIFVAVSDTGSSDRVMTSPDGITWTTQTTPDGGYVSVAWSPQLRLFAAPSSTGSTNKIITSPDAITWTTRSVSNDAAWREMIWVSELGLFVAVAFNGTQRVITSPDGINWTLRNAAAANQWFSVAWSSELKLLVAVSSGGANNNVMISADAINWESRTTNSNNYFGITWAPELGIFVATATSGTGNRIMTSSLRGRTPTSYNVFDDDSNRINNVTRDWTLKSSNIYSDGNIQINTANTTILNISSGGANVNGNLGVTGNTTLTGNLVISGSTTLTGNLVLSGNTTFSGTVTGNGLVSTANVLIPIGSSFWSGANTTDDQSQKLRISHAGNTGVFVDWNESITNNSKITFRYGGSSPTPVFAMDGLGRLGVGTASPSQNLTVFGDASVSTTLSCGGDFTTTGNASVNAMSMYFGQVPFRIQYGNTAVANSGNVIFDVAYSATPIVIVSHIRDSTTAASVWVKTASASNFTWECRNNSNNLAETTLNWVAYGTVIV
jgi:hypothetical protein